MTRRRKLTRSEHTQLWVEQKGLCVCGCGNPLVAGEYDDEHQLPIGLGGGNELSNRALMLRDCHKVKTAQDIARIAKAERQKRFHETGRSSAKKHVKKIPARGFSKDLRRKLDGTVERISQ